MSAKPVATSTQPANNTASKKKRKRNNKKKKSASGATSTTTQTQPGVVKAPATTNAPTKTPPAKAPAAVAVTASVSSNASAAAVSKVAKKLEEDPRVTALFAVARGVPIDMCRGIVSWSDLLMWHKIIRLNKKWLKTKDIVTAPLRESVLSEESVDVEGNHRACIKNAETLQQLTTKILLKFRPNLKNKLPLFSTLLDHWGRVTPEKPEAIHNFEVPVGLEKIRIFSGMIKASIFLGPDPSGEKVAEHLLAGPPSFIDVKPGKYTLSLTPPKTAYHLTIVGMSSNFLGYLKTIKETPPLVLSSYRKAKKELDEIERASLKGIEPLLDLPPGIIKTLTADPVQCARLSTLLKTATPLSETCPLAIKNLFATKDSRQFGYSYSDGAWARGTDWGITLTLRRTGTCRIDFSSVTERRNDDVFIRKTAEGIWTISGTDTLKLTTLPCVEVFRCSQTEFTTDFQNPTTQTLTFQVSPPSLVPSAKSSSSNYKVTSPLALDARGYRLTDQWCYGWGNIVDTGTEKKAARKEDNDVAPIISRMSSYAGYIPVCQQHLF